MAPGVAPPPALAAIAAQLAARRVADEAATLKDERPGGGTPSLRIVTANIPLHPEGGAATTPRSAEATTPPARVNPSDRWALCRREAAAIEPGHIGTLLWIDARCQAAGMHALDAWWVGELRRFYASGKLVFAARVGLRGGKSVTICRALVNDALFMMRTLDPGAIGVIAIMSVDRTGATDRFHTIRRILSACGVCPKKDDGDDVSTGGGLMMTYESSTLPSGGGVIKVTDSQGHDIQFRIYPARVNGVVDYTGAAGFGDEVDLWPVDLGVDKDEVAQKSAKGRANPADVVLDRWLERFTTTIESAHLYLVSATYQGPDSAHARKIEEGDTDIQMVARLGAIGAARDTAARQWLADQIGIADPRLVSPSDPKSTNVAAWATNPSASIKVCFALSKSRIGPMLGRYGGRPDEVETATAATVQPYESLTVRSRHARAELVDEEEEDRA